MGEQGFDAFRRGHRGATLERLDKNQCQDAQAEVITEQTWHDLRPVVAHDPVAAAEQTGRRNARIDALIDQASAWADKLDAQDLGAHRRGRPDRGPTARLYHAVAEAHLSRIIKVDLKVRCCVTTSPGRRGAWQS